MNTHFTIQSFFTRKRVLFVIVLSALVLHLLLASYVRLSVLHDEVMSGDESSMLFQARLFAHGHLYRKNRCPSVGGVFKRHHVVLTKQREYSKYPPGIPALAAVAIIFGDTKARLVNLLLSTVALLLLSLIVIRTTRSYVALLVAVTGWVTSTTVHFHAASLFSHNAVLVSVLALMYVLMQKKPSAFAVGAICGVTLFFRPFDALLSVVALFPLLLYLPERKGKVVVHFGTVFAVFLLLFLGYQYLYTGSPFLSPYAVYRYGHSLKTGSHLGEIGTAGGYISNGLLALTPLWLKTMVSWSSLLLFLSPGALFLLRSERYKKQRLLMLFTVFLMLSYLFGYALHNAPGGDSYGARYYFPLIGPLLISAAFVADYLMLYPRKYVRFAVVVILLVSVVRFYYDFSYKTVGIERRVSERLKLYRDAAMFVGNFGKSIVLIKNPPVMDAAWYVRDNPFADNTVLFGAYPWDHPELLTAVQACYPNRHIVVVDYEGKKSEWIRYNGGINE